MKKTSMKLPEDVWERGHIRALQERRDFQDVVADALEMYLKAKPRKEGQR
jgi:hypothetical protein